MKLDLFTNATVVELSDHENDKNKESNTISLVASVDS